MPLNDALVVRTRRCYRHARRIEVRNLPRVLWITNVEHSNPRIEKATRQRGRVALVVYAAVVTAIGEDREAHEVWHHLGAVLGIVRLQSHPRDQLGIRLVTDVDNAWHREW